jgi:hypothetical protein
MTDSSKAPIKKLLTCPLIKPRFVQRWPLPRIVFFGKTFSVRRHPIPANQDIHLLSNCHREIPAGNGSRVSRQRGGRNA